MRTLVINTYGGSLLLGAHALGCNVLASLEDSAFGLGIQQANFPHLNYYPVRRSWPKKWNLSETVVVAHPPCSAFSVQNCSPGARGVNSAAFACTRDVLQYAMSNNALAVAVESVMGALAGAWPIHQHFADTHGYHLYRILQNGAMFSPQWRERFWVVYIRKGVAPELMTWRLVPRWQKVKDVITGHEDGPSPGNIDRLLADQKRRLVEETGLTDAEMSYLFDPQDPHHPTSALGTILWKTKFRDQPKWEIFKKHIGGFASGTMCFIDPNGLAPVLMGGSHWYANGRNLSETAYKRIAGFPAEYIFPSTPRNYRSQMRMYLSKGVIPAVATWILENVFHHLGMLPADLRQVETTTPPYTIHVRPNYIADFRPHKRQLDAPRPPLRHEEEEFSAEELGVVA